MATPPSGGVDFHRAALADLELIAQARDAVAAADEHLDMILREVKARRLVTVEQIGDVLGITRRAVYKRLDRTG